MKHPLPLVDILQGAGDLALRSWEHFRPGITASWIYQDGESGAAAAFLKYEKGAGAPAHQHIGFEHILVLDGSQSDENGHYGAGTVLISPPGTRHSVHSAEGCVVLAIWEKPVAFES